MVSFFGAPKTLSYYNSTSPIRSNPVLRHGKDHDKDTKSEENGKPEGEPEVEKTRSRRKTKEKDPNEPETETEVNTRLNALLYHTSNETVDLYKQENNSSDLLGRLYYDDYDSDTLSSPDPTSPVMSPSSLSPSSDYFTSRLSHASSSSPSISSTLFGNQTTSALASRSPSATNLRPGIQRIKSFERGVSFDTSTDDHRKSLTFKVKHPQFRFRRNNKTFLAGFNNDLESLKAIEWLFDEMIVHGDTVVILQVLDEKQNSYIDKRRANKGLSKIELLNTHFKKVSLVFEVVIGNPQKLLKKAIDEYSPAMMIIGTRHYGENASSHHKLFLSKQSMSKHFLECALVPVIIVKPTYNHVEMLPHPIESELYFHNLLADIDTTGTYTKDKSKRKTKLHLVNPLSPSSSKSNSHTNIAKLSQTSERTKPASTSKDNQQFAHNNEVEDRGRQHMSRKAENVPKFLLSGSNSRSRSRSSSKPRDFSRIFGSHN